MRPNVHILRRHGRLVRFAVTGAVNTALVYAAFSLLMRHHLHYVAACCCSSCVGLASSYLLNRSYTFRARRPIAPREIAAFLLGYALQLVLGILIYAVLIDHFSMRYQLAFPIDLVAVAAFSYTFMDRIVFQATSPQLSSRSIVAESGQVKNLARAVDGRLMEDVYPCRVDSPREAARP